MTISMMWTPDPRYLIQDSTSVDLGFQEVFFTRDSGFPDLDSGFKRVGFRILYANASCLSEYGLPNMGKISSLLARNA